MSAYDVGKLVEIIEAPDQNKYLIKLYKGKFGILLGKSDIDRSSSRVWDVLIDGKVLYFHELDMKVIVHREDKNL